MVEAKTIYLDWNIFQDIKQNRQIDSLIENLDAAKKRGYILPYSYSHIRDLSRCGSEFHRNEDLSFINELTGKNLLHYSPKDESDFYIENRDSTEVMDYFVKNKQLVNSKNSTSILFVPFHVDMSKIPKDNILVPYLVRNKAIMSSEVVTQFAVDLRAKIFDDYTVHRAFKKSMKDVISLNSPVFVDVLEMPVYRYLLSDETTIRDNFQEILSSFLSISKKTIETIPYGEKITTAYNILDFFPAFSEKIEKRNNIKNISTDAEHAFFASGSKYYITSDTNAKKKTDLIYGTFGLSTKVYLKGDFCANVSFT